MRKIFTFLLLALFSATMFAQEEHTYTVVGGSAALFTESWNPALAVNDLTKVEEGIYTITFENKALNAGTIEYKIVEDHSWTVSYPQDGNTSFKIPKTATYDVTFTLDLSKDPQFSVEATEKGEADIDDVAQLAGTFNDWSPADMTLSGDKSKASITLDLEKGSYYFKVVINDGWHGDGYAFTRENNTLEDLKENTANMSITTDVKGEYTFTWTFESNTLSVSFPELANSAVTIAAPAHGSISVLKGEEAVASGDNVEELTVLTVSLSDNTEDYLFSNLRAFKTDEPETTVAITDGKLTMPEFAITITADEAARKLANGFYLVGMFGGVDAWGIDDLTADKKFYVNPNNEEEYMLIIDLGIADEFKVFEVRDDAFVGYYPDGLGNNYIVDADHAGKNKYIYFDTDEHDGWHYGHIFVPDNATTAIDNTNVDANVMKRIENGQLIIRKNGVKYNVVGAVVE